MPPNLHKSSDSDLESIISQQDWNAGRRKEPKYFCTQPGCEAKFKRLDALDLHLFKHTGVKKHACTYEDCSKTYRTLTHLKRHVRTTHERKGPAPKTVACLVQSCKKMFPDNFNMQRHMREVHENRKVYYCKHCREEFRQKLKLRRHEITKHTNEYPFNCDKCGKGIFLRWQYERHVETCKVYPCPDCKQVFEKWTLYLAHCKEKQHGRKYYKCEQCSNVYSRPSELKKHVGAHHLLGEGQVGAYKCSHEGCERHYAYERNLKQHMRTAHGGKRYACDIPECESSFTNTQNLAKHKQREHGEGKTPVKPVAKTPKRKKRKDAGKAIVSNLARFSNLAVDKQFDGLLRDRDESALAEMSKKLVQEQAQDETETERSEQEDASEQLEAEKDEESPASEKDTNPDETFSALVEQALMDV